MIEFAQWTDECGKDQEEFIGEVSTRWVEAEAECYFGRKLGEEITLEVIDVDA